MAAPVGSLIIAYPGQAGLLTSRLYIRPKGLKTIISETKMGHNMIHFFISFCIFSRHYQHPENHFHLEQPDGSLASKDIDKAEVLNNFFSGVFTREDINTLPLVQQCKLMQDFPEVLFTPDIIKKKLDKLKTGKSPGPDGVHPKVLKELSAVLAKPLAIIFNKSFESGCLPDEWKIANVIPIFKKGNRHSPANYRPVSLTSIVCKVMESIIREHMLSHMLENKLMSDHQHGFLPRKSTVTQLLETLEIWTDALDRGESLDTIYLDFMKAFDTVPHQRLATKLQKYGIEGNTLRWIQSFLTGRKQQVIVNGCKSSFKEVLSGIPQGSVLGPILFVIFINDLPEIVSCGIKLFADDAKIYRTVNSMEDCDDLQKDLLEMENWAKQWQMKFHPNKCQVMRIGRHHPDYTYVMHDNSTGQPLNLEESEVEKDLGVFVDNRLSFTKHIQQTVSKANKIVGMIRRTFKYLDEKMMISLYKSQVRPILEYGVTIWHPTLKKDIKSTEAVQRRLTKLVPHLKDLSYPDRLRRLKLPSLTYRRFRGDMINTWKFLNAEYNVDEALLFRRIQGSSTRGHSKKLFKPRYNISLRGAFFSQRVITMWNELPEEAATINQFKNALDRAWARETFLYDFEAAYH